MKDQDRWRRGFASPAEIIENAVESLSDEHDPECLRPHAKRVTDELIRAHLRDQASWPHRTEGDRLDRSFAELERAGIFFRQNFNCCGTCGATKIRDEIKAARASVRQIAGYTFYHEQDTGAAARLANRSSIACK